MLNVLVGTAKRVTSASAVPATLTDGTGAGGTGAGGDIGLTVVTGFAVAVTVTMIGARGC